MGEEDEGIYHNGTKDTKEFKKSFFFVLASVVLFVSLWLTLSNSEPGEMSCADGGRYDRLRNYEAMFCCLFSLPGLPGPPEALLFFDPLCVLRAVVVNAFVVLRFRASLSDATRNGRG